jgi:copper chaperone CopZ
MIGLLLNALLPIRVWKGRSGHCHCHEHGHHHDHDCECCEEEHCHIEDASRALTLYKYNIKGMHCNHCAANAQKAIASVNGVTEVTVSLEHGEAHVEGEFDEDEVRRAVEALGFNIEKS